MGDEPVPLVPVALLSRLTPGNAELLGNGVTSGQGQLGVQSGHRPVCSRQRPTFRGHLAGECRRNPSQCRRAAAGHSRPRGTGRQSRHFRWPGCGRASLPTICKAWAAPSFFAASTNRLAVAAIRGDSSIYSDLAYQLNQIQGQKRIWPLYESFDPVEPGRRSSPDSWLHEWCRPTLPPTA